MAGTVSVFPHEFGDELLLQIFADVPPEDNLCSLQLACKKFRAVANDRSIWKRHCITSFQYWRDEAWFRDKVDRERSSAARAEEAVDWKEVWLRRRRINARVANLLDGIIETKVGRLGRFGQICHYGYDARDFLLEQLRTAEDAEDVLARRYFVTSILGSLQRGLAVQVWARLHESSNRPNLDQAFGAFDMFVLHDQPQDLAYISSWFDDAASAFRDSHPDLDKMSTRSKSLVLARWLRDERGFRGIPHEEDYRNFSNCLIGHAISDPDHPSLPLVSSVIFASVAVRVGLDAGCCNPPMHVHVVISAPPGQDLDGNTLPSDQLLNIDRMYLDPYTSAQEIRRQEIDNRRAAYFAAPIPGGHISFASFHEPAPLSSLVSRMAGNLMASYALASRLPEDSPLRVAVKSLRTGDPDLNGELCHYASLWANLLAPPPTSDFWDRNLHSFLNRFALNYSEDAWIVSRYLLPLYDAFVSSRAPTDAAGNPRPNRVGWENVREILGMLENLDRRQPQLSRRYTAEIRQRVLYRIGQVFRHRRYGYVGIINGWAAAGLASLPTPHYVPPEDDEQDSDEAEVQGQWEGTRFRRAVGRTYYTCLRTNCDRLRLAQETIEIISDPAEIPRELFFLAGKFFKRFDAATCTFVSNIREFYPDD